MSLSLRGKEFNNEILGISITCYKDNENNTPWFIGPQVAKILGHKDPDAAIRIHVKPKHKRNIGTGINDPDVSSGLQSPVLHPQTKLISEAGFWSLVLRSKIPTAEDFKDWVCEDVLPSIREHGYYALPGVLETIKSINNDEICELQGCEKKEFRRESKYKSRLAKDLTQAARGSIGGLVAKANRDKLVNENIELKAKVAELTAELDEIKAGIAEILADDY